MIRFLNKNFRHLIAIAVLMTLGIVTAYVVLQNQRLRIPILNERPYELKAEFETAQAVVAGQGQTIRVAGVRVGDVADIEVREGRGVVTFAIDREFIPVHRDATVLMRPTTGLKDMFFDLDPGTRESGEFDEGETIPVSNTKPDTNLEEILAMLDGDTQAYLRLLLVGAGEGLKGRDRDLGKLLGSLGPLNRQVARLNREVAKRKSNLSDLVHSVNLLTTEVGRSEDELTRLISSSHSSLSAIAEQDPNVQRAVSLLPTTLITAEGTLNSMARFATVMGPTFESLRPFARRTVELNESTRRLAENATPPLRNQIRPFVRSAIEPMPDVRRAARRFADASPGLTTLGRKLNKLGNMAAYNPGGAEPVGTPGRDEGYLYWAGWLGHNSNSIFSAADAHGVYRRIFVSLGCEHVNSLIEDIDPTVEQLRQLITGFTDPVIGAACGGGTP